MIRPDEPPILSAIRHAAVAGRYEEAARRKPHAARTLLKQAEFHRALAGAFVADAIEAQR